MKQLGLLLLVIILQSNIYSQSKNLSPFKEIQVSGGFTVKLVKGDAPKAEYNITKGAEEELQLETKDGKLIIKSKSKGLKWNSSNLKANITVYYQNISSIELAAGASVSNEGSLDANSLSISTSSGSSGVFNIAANKVELSSSSGSRLTVRGKAASVDAEASSGASIDALSLIGETGNAECSSGSSIKLYASKSISAEASSGGSIKYKGNPKTKDIEKRSGGSVTSL